MASVGTQVRGPGRSAPAHLAAAVLALAAALGLAVGCLGAPVTIVLLVMASLAALMFLRPDWGFIALAAALPWYHLTAVPMLERVNLTAFDALGLILLVALMARKLLSSAAFTVRLHATGLLLLALTCWTALAFSMNIPGNQLAVSMKPYLAVAVFYWISYTLARGEASIRTALVAFVAGTALAEATGLMELHTGIGLLGQAAEPVRLMGASGSLVDTDLTRVAGLYGDPNFYAMTALAALPPAGALLLTVQRGWRKHLLLVAVAVLSLSVLLGASRGVAAAVVVAALVFFSLTSSRHRYQILGLVLFLAIAFLLLLPRAYFSRLLVTGDKSSLNRVELEQVAMAAVEARPYFGSGPDLLVFQPSISGYSYIHNTYLQVAAEAGLPALALFLTVIAAAIVTATKAHRRRRVSGADVTLTMALLPALAAFTVFLLFFSYFGSKTFWFLAALASAAAQRQAVGRPEGGVS